MRDTQQEIAMVKRLKIKGNDEKETEGMRHGETRNLSLGRMMFDYGPDSEQNDPNRVRATLSVSTLDRTGILASVSRWIRKHEANIDASYTTRLEDISGGFYLLTLSRQHLEEMILETKIQQEDQGEQGIKVRDGESYTLRIIAPDRVGIVNDASEVLDRNAINIVTMASRTFSPPQQDSAKKERVPPDRSGRMFIIQMNLEVPRDSLRFLPQVMDELRRIGGEKWDIRMEEGRGRAGFSHALFNLMDAVN